MPRKKEIDEIDLKILEIFQTDASITNRELAQKIGLTPGPTLIRVQHLYENDYLVGSYAAINWAKLGYKYRCSVITQVDEKDAPKFERLVRNVQGCMETARISRETKIPSKFKLYGSICKYKTEQDFINAWSDLVSKCDYPIEFQVFVTKGILSPRRALKLEI